MQAGWYAHIQNPGVVAYFDGTSWGTVRDGFALSQEIQKTITPLQPGHPGPPAPFESQIAAGPRPKKPGSNWSWGIGAGAFLFLCGLIRGFSSAGDSCGAPFKKDTIAALTDALAAEAGLSTNYVAQCNASVADATALAWVLIILGVIVTLASFLIQAVIRSGQANRTAVVVPPAAPSVAAQIEDLARLRDQGLVTQEEYEWKRQELLRRV